MNMFYTKARNTNDVTQLELDNRELARKLAHEAIVLLKNNAFLYLYIGRILLRLSSYHAFQKLCRVIALSWNVRKVSP